jgi:hypothetical protein
MIIPILTLFLSKCGMSIKILTTKETSKILRQNPSGFIRPRKNNQNNKRMFNCLKSSKKEFEEQKNENSVLKISQRYPKDKEVYFLFKEINRGGKIFLKL